MEIMRFTVERLPLRLGKFTKKMEISLIFEENEDPEEVLDQLRKLKNLFLFKRNGVTDNGDGAIC